MTSRILYICKEEGLNLDVEVYIKRLIACHYFLVSVQFLSDFYV